MPSIERRTEIPQGRDAYQRLIAEIRAGTLMPGDRLLETELATRLGISRTPVREAIRRLEADGLVNHVPRSGAAIRKLDYSEVTELYEMRVVLETTAARLAARTASEVELSEMEAINAEMGDAPARNRYLGHSMRALQKTMLILGPSTMEETGRAAEAIAEHANLLVAMRNRDEARAEAAMREHMLAAHRSRLRQFRERPLKDEEE
jgi:DNA-binding GntR family transcriptional regulator